MSVLAGVGGVSPHLYVVASYCDFEWVVIDLNFCDFIFIYFFLSNVEQLVPS